MRQKKLYHDGRRKFTNFTLDLVCFSNRNIHICLNVCVCGCVPYITKLYKKNPEIEKRKTESFHGPCDVIVDVDDDRKEKNKQQFGKRI